ncbi:hypothetical protein ACFYPG_09865 [Micromonospora sp. NPDC005553]|uniref:hypothetical protein n=1 Tax=Micromonospora sp. NPDC005553 TaxID=3364232 RepID=UPI0036888802
MRSAPPPSAFPGEGLLVERTGERSIVVTVADAGTAAALLNTLADRHRRTH